MNKSADAQPDYCMMTHAIETSVDQIMMDVTSDREYAGRALATPEFGPRNLYANLGGIGMIDGNFLVLIWTPTDLSHTEMGYVNSSKYNLCNAAV